MPSATHVWTSSDNVIWNQDAKYFYYAHGPLARVEYGNDKAQGVDYAYTLQGWIKGVNSNTLSSARDIGKDGDGDTLNVNGSFAKDAFGYTLGYFAGDYKAAAQIKWNSVTNRFEAQTAGAQFMADQHDLYNGNIAHMQTTIIALDTAAGGIANGQTAKPQAMAYQYDQLNRIKHGIAFNNIDIPNNLWQSSGQATAHMYENAFTYDANGNILNQKRYNDAGTLFDNMTYQYKKEAGEETQNRLYHVNDSITSTVMTDDIDDEGTFDSTATTINTNNNYRYDEIGNLKHDSQEEIDTIKWTVYGKIKEIKRTSGSSKHNLSFDYDASGNRIAKHEYTSSGSWLASTYYTRDAQGNTMATYRQTDTGASLHFKLQEQDIYGSSRAGMKTPNIEMIGAIVDTVHIYDTVGQKTFEGANHLGNVLTTFSDRKIPVDTNSDLIADYKLADVLSGNDYSPFGAPLNNRGFAFGSYIYGFEKMPKDDEMFGEANSYDFGSRIYSPRISKFLSIDPYFTKYPYLSPFAHSADSPILFIDAEGKGPIVELLKSITEPVFWLASFTSTTIQVQKNASAGFGLGGFGGAAAMVSEGIAIDPQGNFGIVLSAAAFADAFSAFGTKWAASTATGTGDKGGVKGGNMVLGAEVSATIGVNFSNKQNILGLGGNGTSGNVAVPMDIVLGEGIAGGVTAGNGSFGLALGVGLGAAVSAISSPTFVLATNWQDLGELEDSFNAASKYAKKIKGTLEVVASIKDNTVSLSFNVTTVGKDGKKTTKAMFEPKTKIIVDKNNNTVSTSTVSQKKS